MAEVDRAVLDADFFVSYLRGDELSVHSEALYQKIRDGGFTAEVSSEVFDDIVSAYRSQGYTLSSIVEIMKGLETVPLEVFGVTAQTARLALSLYKKVGGRRKLHYFDAYHVATTRLRSHNTLVTSDKFILEQAAKLQIEAMDLRTF